MTPDGSCLGPSWPSAGLAAAWTDAAEAMVINGLFVPRGPCGPAPSPARIALLGVPAMDESGAAVDSCDGSPNDDGI